MKRLVSCGAAWLLAAGASVPAEMAGAPRAVEIVERATDALARALSGPRGVIPPAVMAEARAVAVFPASPIESGFHYGYGVVGARAADRRGWLRPAIASVRAVARPPRGMRAGDLILVAISRRGFDFLAQDEVRLPEGLSIPAGPTAVNTPLAVDADILAYARYGRLFAGIGVETLTIFEDPPGIQQLYGRPVSMRDLLYGKVEPDASASIGWRRMLDTYYRELR